MTFTTILHAYRWPNEQALTSLRASFASAVPAGARLDVVEVREEDRRAVGAAALVNRAAAGSAADALIVAEPSSRFAPEAVASFLRVSDDGLVHDGDAPARLWAIRRDVFERAGGLDSRLWSVGYVEDLAARLALSGIAVTPIRVNGVWHGPEAYPLRAEARDLLVIRNRLITAFKTRPVADLGRELAGEAAVRLMRAWRAARIDPSAFSFGSPARVPGPEDEAATLVPLLALDAFLAELPALSAERQRLWDECVSAGTASGDAGAEPSDRPDDPAELIEWLHSRLVEAGG